MTMGSEVEENKEVSLKPFFARHFLLNFSNGIISPYISVYAVQLGASSTEMGWLRSLMNLFGNITQVFWGSISDRLGRYVPAILFGGLFSALLWLPLLIVNSPTQFILVITIQSFATSIMTPAWASLIGWVAPKSKRGTVTSHINIAASLGSTGATLLSGYLMTLIGGSLSSMYLLPIVFASLTGLISSIVMIRVREDKKQEPSQTTWLNWDLLRNNRNFRTLCMVSSVHSFFMSISWPLFAITTVRIVQADMLEIAFISVISSFVSIFVRRIIGRITDKAGRRFLLIGSRAIIFIYPTLYALATNVYHLLLANLIGGVFGAIAEIVLFVYQLDITRPEQRGASIALYNTIIGVATFFGSLAGGYLPTLFLSAGVTDTLSLQLTYAISALGRFGGGLLFMKLKEPTTYSSTVRGEFTRIVTEDIERTRDQIRQIELRGATIDDELQQDFDWIVGLTKKKENG
jgi:MFS family permease